MSDGIFDINNARDFLLTICSSFKAYQTPAGCVDERALFLITASYHLREWIASGYKPRDKNGKPLPPNNEAETFFNDIYAEEEFEILNHRGHSSKTPGRDFGYSRSGSAGGAGGMQLDRPCWRSNKPVLPITCLNTYFGYSDLCAS